MLLQTNSRDMESSRDMEISLRVTVTEFLISEIHSLADVLHALHKIPSSLIFQKKWNWKLAICVIDTTDRVGNIWLKAVPTYASSIINTHGFIEFIERHKLLT